MAYLGSDFFGFERGINLGPVKTYDNGAANVEHWNTALAGFFNRFAHGVLAALDIFVFVFNTKLI